MSEQGKPIPVTLPDGTKMVFQHIPAGSFRIGQRGEFDREEPVTLVKVGEFWMGETPVTQAQYRAMAKECGADLAEIEGNKGPEPSRFKGDQKPVEQVNWLEARAVAKWLTGAMERQGKLPKGYVVDLPWESQWEYACRAGSETEYHTGDGKAALEKVGWFGDNQGKGTHPVGELEANDWGLFDMHGNVFEWCRDIFKETSHRLIVPGEPMNESPEGEGDRVLRGGSWFLTAWDCRSAARFWYRPGFRYRGYGFRLALVPGLVQDQSEGPEARKQAEPGAAAVEGWDAPEPTPREGGAISAEADLNRNFPPRSGGDFLTENRDDDGNDE